MSNRYTPRNRVNQLGLNSRRIGALEREKNPASAATTFPAAVSNLAVSGDLRGYWRLGEGATPYLDTSGNAGGAISLDLVAAGTAMTQDYNPGALPTADDDGAVYFNASAYNVQQDLIRAADTRFQVGALSGYTLCAWIRPGFFSAANHQILGNYQPAAGYGMWLTNSGHISFDRDSVLLEGPLLTLDQWVFVCCVYGPTAFDARVYLNGSQVAFMNDGAQNGGAGGTSFRVGSNGTGGPNYASYKGGVDEVSVWGTALTAAQIATLYTSGGGAAATTAAVAALSVTGAYTLTSTDATVFANGTFTITLPTAVGATGKRYTVKNTGAGTITVGRTSAQNIDGAAANVTLATTKQAREFTSDGAGWQMTAAYL